MQKLRVPNEKSRFLLFGNQRRGQGERREGLLIRSSRELLNEHKGMLFNRRRWKIKRYLTELKHLEICLFPRSYPRPRNLNQRLKNRGRCQQDLGPRGAGGVRSQSYEIVSFFFSFWVNLL